MSKGLTIGERMESSDLVIGYSIAITEGIRSLTYQAKTNGELAILVKVLLMEGELLKNFICKYALEGDK